MAQTDNKTTQTDKPIQDMAKDTADAAKARGESLADQARSAAKDGLERGKQEVHARAEGARDAAVDETRETGEAIREAGERFEDGDYRYAAAMQIADTLDGVAMSLRERDLDDVRRDVEGFARRNPVLFFAGAALTGFALSRLVKATARDDDQYNDGAAPCGAGYNAAAYDDRADIVDYPGTTKPQPPVTPGASVGARGVHGGGA